MQAELNISSVKIIGQNSLKFFGSQAEGTQHFSITEIVELLKMIKTPGLFGYPGNDPPDDEIGLPPDKKTPDNPAVSTYVKPIILPSEIRSRNKSKSPLGAGDAVNIGSVIIGGKLVATIKGLVTIFEISKAAKDAYSGNWDLAFWGAVEIALGGYDTAAKLTYVGCQTDFMKMGVGSIYYEEKMNNWSWYKQTGNEFYLNKAIFYDNLIRSDYFKSLN